MEKIFHPGKWFVGFCALLIVVFGLLQYVRDARLQDMSKIWASEIFDWDWPDRHFSSVISDMKAKVLSKTDGEAQVHVEGKQKFAGGEAAGKSSETECGATLTFYKKENDWFLARVEFDK